MNYFEKNSRENNLDFIRLIAATLVIYAHSYPLTQTYKENNIWGGLAVDIFFLISGFLITFSYERSKNIKDYLISRILRIYPALIFCFLITVFLFGIIDTKLSINDYLKSKETYTYFIGVTSLNFLQKYLPGVFEANFEHAVNGSLWTIKYEILCYISVIFSYNFLKKYKKTIPFLVIILYVLSVNTEGKYLTDLFHLLSVFYTGVFFFFFKDFIKLKLSFFAFTCLAMLILIFNNEYSLALFLCLPYIVFYLGYSSRIFSNFANKNDISYGVYIYGFTIQQLVISQTNNSLSIFSHFLLSTSITFIFAFISWRYIEKPALNLKKKLLYKKI